MALAMDAPPMRRANWTRIDAVAEREGQAERRLRGTQLMRPKGKSGQRSARLASYRA
jgi:hypothetical protein